MKKLICALLTCALLLAVCAGCGKKEQEASFQPEQTVQALLDSGAFSETLEELDPTLLFTLPGNAEDYAGSLLVYSTGATAETAAVMLTPDTDRAQQVQAALQAWVDGQIEAERNYRPAEVEKLEHAILETRGNSVLLVVAADWEKAAQAIPAE
ncbi:MAG: DUF4358 domain-containing protein [Oscillospiraceae bacterium]